MARGLPPPLPTQTIDFSSQGLPNTLCSQNVDFVISVQFLAILPKLSFLTQVDPIWEPLYHLINYKQKAKVH